MKKKIGLIYNASVASKKFLEVNSMYIDAAKQRNIELELIKNTDILSKIVNNQHVTEVRTQHNIPECILFLEKDIRLAYHLEKSGYKIFNSSEAIRQCDDKALTAQILAKNHITLPKTLLSHLHYPGFIEETTQEQMQHIACIESNFDYPFIIKEVFGSFGSQVYLIHTREELIQKRNVLLYTPHIYQEFISSSWGKDVRLQVVGDRVEASVLRVSEHDFRANVTNGGTMYPFDPPKEFIDMAVQATQILQADFAGVDILFGEQGEPILCEVNSNAHIKNIFDCTKINIADHILDHILEQI